MSDQNEKRKEKRHNVIWNIYGKLNNEMKHIGYLKNLSLTGLLFRSKYFFKSKDKIELRITAPEKLFDKINDIFLSLNSEIIHIVEINHKIYHFEYGAKFIDIDQATIKNLDIFLKFWVEKETLSD